MKRFVSCMLSAAVLLSALCFGGCATSENREMSELMIARKPDTTRYELFDEEGKGAGFTIGDRELSDADLFLENICNEYKTAAELTEALETAEFTLRPDLTGMIAVARYSNGTTETLDNAELTVTLADPANLGELYAQYIGDADYIKQYREKEDEDVYLEFAGKIAEMVKKDICRNYTVRVAYKGFEQEFTVSVYTRNGEWQEDVQTDRYEFVRIEDEQTERVIPLSSMEYVEEAYSEELEGEGEGYIQYHTLLETDGMYVILRDHDTGEEKKLGSENFELYLSISCPIGTTPPSGEYEAEGAAWIEYEPTEKYPEGMASFEISYRVHVINDIG